MYDLALGNKPLNANDAEVVQVIHTDMLQAGAPFKSGTIDFYPNGGGINGIQPGCPIFDKDNLFIPGSKLTNDSLVNLLYGCLAGYMFVYLYDWLTD